MSECPNDKVGRALTAAKETSDAAEVSPPPADRPDAADLPPPTDLPPRDEFPTAVVVWLVRQYQWWLSPIFGGRCRFFPSCSEYAIGAVRKYGVVRGGWRGFCRICRCHPFHPGGIDFP